MKKLLLFLFLFRVGTISQAQVVTNPILLNDGNIPVVHLSVHQNPSIQVVFADTLSAVPGNLLLLDTLVKVQGITEYSFSWSILKDQNLIPINNTIQVNENTIVYFKLTYHEGCTYSDHFTLYTDATVNIPNIAGNIKIYPNPAKEKIIVELANTHLPVCVTLVNHMGMRVSEKILEAGINFPVVAFEITNQLSGFYFIRLNTGKDIFVKKVIIIK